MKTLTLLFAAGMGFIANTHAAEAPKPLLQLSAKKQVLDTNRDKLGWSASSKQKTYALRVELYNATSTTVTESVLTGTALVSRVVGAEEKIVKEPLGEVKVPAMKPNEKITLEIGEIELREVEWGRRKFEENLEEWKVTCSQGEVEIGTAMSSDNYVVVVKEAVTSGSEGPEPGFGFGQGDRGPKRFPKR